MLTASPRNFLVALSTGVMVTFGALPARAQSRISVPEALLGSPAVRMLNHSWEQFNQTFGRGGTTISSMEFAGDVDEVATAVGEMMETIVIPVLQGDLTRGRMRLITNRDLRDLGEETAEELDRLRQSLELNVEPGDLLFKVRIDSVGQETTVESLNSMSRDGNRFSGAFFATARIPGGPLQRVKRRNTICETRVITRYIWGAPAETITACASLDQETGSCWLSEIHATPGFFAEIKTLPDRRTRLNLDGNCCRASVQWAWATGFKSIKVSAGEASLEVEGNIGQSANGFFTVEECKGD